MIIFKQYYRPKLPRNKYGALTKNHLTRSTSAGTYAMRSAAQPPEVIDLGNIYRYEEIESVEYAEGTEPIEPADIIIETETTPETE
jgi:hypothetical protein